GVPATMRCRWAAVAGSAAWSLSVIRQHTLGPEVTRSSATPAISVSPACARDAWSGQFTGDPGGTAAVAAPAKAARAATPIPVSVLVMSGFYPLSADRCMGRRRPPPAHADIDYDDVRSRKLSC